MTWRCNMNRQRMIAEIKQNFMIKRARAQEECDDFVNNLRKNPDFETIYREYNEKQLAALKKSFSNEYKSLQNDVDLLRDKIEKYVSALGLNKDNLYPHYDCPICHDTGVDGTKMCRCLLNELNQKFSLATSSQKKFKNFSSCDVSIMDEHDKQAMDILKLWCKNYPNVNKLNINIIGGAGSGKTFMLECVANELINKGHIVCYKTAFEINELARLYHIGKSYDFSDCLDAEVLLIDDLGTEPILKNVTKEYFYNLINTRQIQGKPTLISTNLSAENLLDRYDDRIYSRLANKKLAINIELTKNDKRI